MHIHWFPGHMTKALRDMKESAAAVDSFIYVLDARAPSASVNHAFDEIIGEKPRLYVLNKADLVPADALNRWKKLIELDFGICVCVNSALKNGAGVLLNALKQINAPLIERYREKGVKKTVRAMVIGVPNCGKSTLINSLTAKKRAATGDRPGVTRGKQWISIDPYIDLLDTPGTLYPDFSDQKKAVNLAIIGSIKDDVLDVKELADEILKFMSQNHADALKARYGEMSGNPLECVAKSRGCVMKGGELDLERAARAVILDFRNGAFGKIILEK